MRSCPNKPAGANTNTIYITQGLLGPYTAKTLGVYKCPADKIPSRGGPRVRSVSMNTYLARQDDAGNYVALSPSGTYKKFTELKNPTMIWVFVDEHPDSINDAAFAVQMAVPSMPLTMGDVRIIDFPASYHNGACGFSFADGHSEIHKWHGSSIRLPVTGVYIHLDNPAGDAKNDIVWLSDVTTVAK